MPGSSDPDPAAMRAAYEAGASLHALARQHRRGEKVIRALIVGAGGTIRTPTGGTTGAQQTNSAERAARVLTVLGLMLKGIDRNAIHRHGNEVLGWDVEPRTIAAYMADARAEVRARYADEAETLAAMADARDDYARQRALAVDDVKTFHSVNTEANKRHGLYAAAKTELTGPGGTELVIRFVDAPAGDNADD